MKVEFGDKSRLEFRLEENDGGLVVAAMGAGLEVGRTSGRLNIIDLRRALRAGSSKISIVLPKVTEDWEDQHLFTELLGYGQHSRDLAIHLGCYYENEDEIASSFTEFFDISLSTCVDFASSIMLLSTREEVDSILIGAYEPYSAGRIIEDVQSRYRFLRSVRVQPGEAQKIYGVFEDALAELTDE